MAATSRVGSIKKHFRRLKDPRVVGRTRHRLSDIIVLAICGVIGNCDDWPDIALFAEKRKAWFGRFLDLPNGVPAHDTFERVFAALDPRALERCCVAWLREVAGLVGVRPHRHRRQDAVRVGRLDAGAAAPGQRLGHAGPGVARAGGRGRQVERDHGHPGIAGVIGPEGGAGDHRRDRLPEGDRQEDRGRRRRLRAGRQGQPGAAAGGHPADGDAGPGRRVAQAGGADAHDAGGGPRPARGAVVCRGHGPGRHPGPGGVAAAEDGRHVLPAPHGRRPDQHRGDATSSAAGGWRRTDTPGRCGAIGGSRTTCTGNWT